MQICSQSSYRQKNPQTPTEENAVPDETGGKGQRVEPTVAHVAPVKEPG